MFDLSVGIGELILRAAVVYFFLFAIFRFGGKKQIGELACSGQSVCRPGLTPRREAKAALSGGDALW